MTSEIVTQMLELSGVEFKVREVIDNIEFGAGGIFEQQSINLSGTAIINGGYFPDKSETWKSCLVCIAPKHSETDNLSLNVGHKQFRALFYVDSATFFRLYDLFFSTPKLSEVTLSFNVNTNDGPHLVERFSLMRSRTLEQAQ